MADSPQRIAKFLARAGVASRRGAEKMILEGRVQVDGQVIETPALTVMASQDIRVDGQPVGISTTRLWRYHKPKGMMTTHNDPEGRPTVFENLPPELPRVISVGRLDFNTEGLLLLTNDGELSRFMELPAQEFERTYKVRGYGQLDERALEEVRQGVTIEGVHYAPAQVDLVQGLKGPNIWLTIVLTEGKNREVRRLMDHVGLKVNRLIRLSYGPFNLGNLEPGQAVEVPPDQIKKLGVK